MLIVLAVTAIARLSFHDILFILPSRFIIMQKKLAVILVATSFLLPLTYSVARATPSKTKTTIKRKATTRKTARASTKTKKQKPVIPSVEGMIADRYHCEMGKTFTLYRDPNDNQSVILEWAGTRQQMHKIATKTGAERFETDAKLTYIGVSNLSHLIDFKRGKPILSECRNDKQNRIQHELDQKKAEKKATKTQVTQPKQAQKPAKKRSFWPF